MTRLAVMERIADSLGMRLSGYPTTAPTSGTSTVIDNIRRYEQDDFCNEGYFLATSSGGTVCEHRINDFSNGTQTITLYGTLSTSLTTTVAYDIFLPPLTPDHLRSAIKTAEAKLAGRGIGRRPLDTTLVTTAGLRYALPSTIDVELSECYIQPVEYIQNNQWLDTTSGWTLHANASLTNDGTNGANTFKLIATAAAEETYQEIDVSPGVVYEFFANVKGDATATARWRYRIYNSAGTAIVGPTVIGTGVTAAAFAEEKGTIQIPSNGVTMRLSFDASAAGTVYSEAPQLMRYGDWSRISGARVEYDGLTGYLLLPAEYPAGRRLKLIGQRTLEAMTADTDTLSLDEPEAAAFVELACSELWRQFGGTLLANKGSVDTEILKHEQAFKELVGRISGEWRKRKTVRVPQFGSDH